MIHIERSIPIAAPIERCFDLSRSIDLHIASTAGTRERAVSGVTSGLIGHNQTVTWRTKVLGMPIHHTSLITLYDRPRYFQDRMLAGAFKSYCHDHYFEGQSGGTLMRDVMTFEAPLGLAGVFVEKVALSQYMQRLLDKRNLFIRRVAESDEWTRFLPA